ncbi:NUDIX hydrolase [Roseobacter denitrificans]|uniref:Hydrolase, putative n=1 Tax=Roseobacter denitrificans (strain ATCC 33942 / OCh 114) TaxID=375451 RepID=Q162U7_ROSDO|nr:NUDIX hydrolase [Roseobacter denitrificans]ABG32996.1 hydrolase, putative [Roseobacter denitrificans OCh 114]AVL52378.1 NUDIX hydrolase [Roseobacter denitrificans]SFG09840.1 ADP-ribose pyrophosphatase YjhB, NUDIX family [Roseobacter denitrificans OCh 114]
MRPKSPRIAARAIIVRNNRILLVNAWPDGKSTLLCAPGGGVHVGTSLPQNLAREVHEETGLRIEVGAPCLINEFHDPDTGFHQIEVFFRCTLSGSDTIDPDWNDPENIVSQWVWASPEEMKNHRVKPDSLFPVAFGDEMAFSYDPLETIVL